MNNNTREEFTIAKIKFVYPACANQSKEDFDKTYGDKEVSGNPNKSKKSPHHLNRTQADNVYKAMRSVVDKKKAGNTANKTKADIAVQASNEKHEAKAVNSKRLIKSQKAKVDAKAAKEKEAEKERKKTKAAAAKEEKESKKETVK